ncbi:MAG: sugar phosphate isomerase/epimerase family protein [Candidatus Aenigmatarchaeota archaeon]
MLIGSMNNPNNNILKEVKRIVRNFDFLDLTLEMPKAMPEKLNIKALKVAIGKTPVVGHTAWYLPMGSPFKELRYYALGELEKSAEAFEKLGVKIFNVHFDTSLGIIDHEHMIEFNLWSLKRLVTIARKHDLDLMAENTPGLFSNPFVLERVFKKLPRLYLHLDVAHANVGQKNTTPQLVKGFSKRIEHIHISDNRGKEDEHLPLGKGFINWNVMLGAIKKSGYDKTITLEVFTSTKDCLADKSKLRKMWDKL